MTRKFRSKKEILKHLVTKRGELLKLIDKLPEEYLTKPSFDKDWSVKDIFAHLCYWDWWTVSAIDQILAGILPPYFDEETDDEVNEREMRMRRRRNWDEVLEEFKTASQSIVLKLKKTPEKLLFKDTGVRWKKQKITVNWLLAYPHYEEHIKQLKKWRLDLRF